MRPKAGTRSEQVRELIEEAIATGTFPPGMRLDEMELTERFNVSRTPVRETLFQLASAGIVVTQPRHGPVVAEVTPHRLVEMFELMGELEVLYGRLSHAADVGTRSSTFARSASRVPARRGSARSGRYYYQNEQFHQLIHEGSHNDFLRERATAPHRRPRPYRRLQLRVRDRLPNVVSRARTNRRGDHCRRQSNARSESREFADNFIVKDAFPRVGRESSLFTEGGDSANTHQS